MNKCLNCGKEINNKKFCSRSCSAIFNNNISKRKKKEKEEYNPNSLKVCNICLLEKKKSEFYLNVGCCKECYCRKRRDNPKTKISGKIYKEKNKELLFSYQKSRAVFLKMKFLEMYGKKCSCCGESEYEFLTIDHIIPRTYENRNETGVKAYFKAISEYKPDLYQVLCYNCNCGRRHGICPHKLKDNKENIL